MSIVFYGFLGRDTQHLENRFVLEFARIGFEVEIHPKMKLLESNGSGHIYLAFIKIPSHLKRMHPDVPLLAEFEYSACMRTSSFAQEEGWPPRKVRRFTYEIFTRTASGRSAISLYAQALTVAILAKITNGQFFGDGASEAVSGSVELDSILAEIEKHECIDAGAYPFHDWPSMDATASWVPPPRLTSPEKKTGIDSKLAKEKIQDYRDGRLLHSDFFVFYDRDAPLFIELSTSPDI